MKRSTFILVGMLLTVLAIGITSCKYVPAGSLQQVPNEAALVNFDSNTSPIIVKKLGGLGNSTVYSLKKDGVEYLVVSKNWTDGGVTIIKHEPVVQPTVNMDSVVANSPWIDEYSMLGYTQAEPSKESLESLTNPEVRPVPIGSEEAFIGYHTKVSLVD